MLRGRHIVQRIQVNWKEAVKDSTTQADPTTEGQCPNLDIEGGTFTHEEKYPDIHRNLQHGNTDRAEMRASLWQMTIPGNTIRMKIGVMKMMAASTRTQDTIGINRLMC